LGSIGFCSIITETLKNKVFTHDLIRIECNNQNDIGYVYAFLKTKIGNKTLTTNNYGSVGDFLLFSEADRHLKLSCPVTI